LAKVVKSRVNIGVPQVGVGRDDVVAVLVGGGITPISSVVVILITKEPDTRQRVA